MTFLTADEIIRVFQELPKDRANEFIRACKASKEAAEAFANALKIINSLSIFKVELKECKSKKSVVLVRNWDNKEALYLDGIRVFQGHKIERLKLLELAETYDFSHSDLKQTVLTLDEAKKDQITESFPEFLSYFSGEDISKERKNRFQGKAVLIKTYYSGVEYLFLDNDLIADGNPNIGALVVVTRALHIQQFERKDGSKGSTVKIEYASVQSLVKADNDASKDQPPKLPETDEAEDITPDF